MATINRSWKLSSVYDWWVHLLCLNILSYALVKTDKIRKIPIKSDWGIQTYYGVYYYQNKELVVKDYQSLKTENTIKLIKYLQQQRPEKKLAIFEDWVTNHTSQKFPEYLITID